MEYSEIFRAIYPDDSVFLGGDMKYPKWSKCPEGMVQLEVKLPYGDKIVLVDYEKYNFFIGAIKPIQGNATFVSHIYVLGCIGEEVISYRITLSSFRKDNKYKSGDITVRKFPWGKEGLGRAPTSGWKMGQRIS